MDSKIENTNDKSPLAGFSKLTREERLERLHKIGALSAEDLQVLRKAQSPPIELAEHFIENVIGYFAMPLGVAANFCINGREVVVPMAVEETSIVAAASKTAKWVRENGRIETEVVGRNIIGQIQIAKVNDFTALSQVVQAHAQDLIEAANRDVASGLVARGGGVADLQLRRIARGDGADMGIIHVLADPCDAMGANIMNQVCEYLKPKIEHLSGETVTMCILSNLVDTKLTRAKITLAGLDPMLMAKIEEASLFAQLDPYRAATNNKGVLNGIDPILIATGNDWRAVEAGIHAYASRTGRYSSITKWKVKNGELVGLFEAPIVVGVVGGVTKLHPTAKTCLKILDVKSADELAQVCAAVGLVQNLGALRALTTVGIIEGHMKLHIKNLSLGAGAEEFEMPQLQTRLEEILRMTKKISLSHAIEVLKDLRTRVPESVATIEAKPEIRPEVIQ